MIQLIDIQNSNTWQEIVTSFSHYDFYFSQHYHSLSKNKSESIQLLYTEIEDVRIAFPIVIRPIESNQFPNYYDITSVYGYAGPLIDGELTRKNIEIFTNSFIQFCHNNNIISAFARLHTVFASNQIQLLSALGITELRGKTIYIDTQDSLEDQRKEYRKSNKSEINQLKKAGVTIRSSKNIEDINQFIAIYTENMKRVDANSYYFFSYEYFHNFINTTQYDAFLLLAEIDNTIVAGAIFTISGSIMQYHLAGTAESHLNITPMKLILDTARYIATEKKCTLLHLGGGLGGSEDDTLYNFKKGFSKKNLEFYIWKYITNPEIYINLVREKKMDENSTFFPLYRHL